MFPLRCLIQCYCEAGILVWGPISDPQTPKSVKINSSKTRQRTIHGLHALALQCGHSVLSYSECKIAKVFHGFAPGAIAEVLQHPPPPPRPHCQLHNGFFLATLVKKTGNPKKLLDTALPWFQCFPLNGS